MFNVPEDIYHSYVRTTIESFPVAVMLIYSSLTEGQSVWATDNVSFSQNLAKYWVEEGGLRHLRMNYKIVGRGIRVNRIFIVSQREYSEYKRDLMRVRILHAKAGVRTFFAIIEKLPSQCRYDFAIWGDKFVDEVVYAMLSNGIVDNRIHWSAAKVLEFKHKLELIQDLVESESGPLVRRERDFKGVLAYAESIRRDIWELPESRGGDPDIQNKKSQRPNQILLLSANPTDTSRLRLDQEYREISLALRHSKFRDQFILNKEHAVRIADLQEHLLLYKPDIVHFGGHGRASSELVMEAHDGASRPISIKSLEQLFSLLKGNVKCVVLNACYSSRQATAIARHIPCVVGMSQAIEDLSAIDFSRAFYRALGYGKTVQTAFRLGCQSIDMEHLHGPDVPQLLTRSKSSGKLKFC